jgi:hypothetical protein
MTRRKKTVLIVLSIFPGLPLLLVAAALAIRGCDEPPPYDEDLKVQRLEIPDDQNAFTYLQQAIDKLDMPSRQVPLASANAGQKQEGEASESEWDLFYAILSETRWDAPFVERILKRNAEALALWEQGLAAPHFQAPEVKVLWDTPPNVFDYLGIANLISVRSRAAAKRGDYEAAFQDAMKVVRFGQRIQGDKGGIIEYFVGITVKGMGDSLMRNSLAECTLPPARLRDYASELAKLPADVQGLAEALRNEYAIQRDIIDGVKSGKPDYDLYNLGSVSIPGSPGPPFPLNTFVWGTLRLISFKPNATRRAFAELSRRQVRNAPVLFIERVPEHEDIPEFQPFTVRVVWSGNILGRIICRMLFPAAVGATNQKCHANVDLAATRILLALKAYKLEKGKLPATLAELAPEYLDSVPLDDYDGLPMRYNAAKKVVYSVGKDLKDNGGIGTRADHVAAKRKEAEAAGAKLTDGEQKYAEEEFNEWDQPDACFEIKF